MRGAFRFDYQPISCRVTAVVQFHIYTQTQAQQQEEIQQKRGMRRNDAEVTNPRKYGYDECMTVTNATARGGAVTRTPSPLAHQFATTSRHQQRFLGGVGQNNATHICAEKVNQTQRKLQVHGSPWLIDCSHEGYTEILLVSLSFALCFLPRSRADTAAAAAAQVPRARLYTAVQHGDHPRVGTSLRDPLIVGYSLVDLSIFVDQSDRQERASLPMPTRSRLAAVTILVVATSSLAAALVVRRDFLSFFSRGCAACS